MKTDISYKLCAKFAAPLTKYIQEGAELSAYCFPSIGGVGETIGTEDVAAVSHVDGVRGEGGGRGHVVACVRLFGADVAVQPLHGVRVHGVACLFLC